MSDTITTSLGKALALLDCFRDGQTELGVSDMARRVGIAKSSVHRLCAILVAGGHLEKTVRGQYRLGLKIFELGGLVSTRVGIRQPASCFLEELAAASQQTAHLGILDEGEVVYVDKIETHGSRRTPTQVGSREPTYCTGIGKAMLAWAAPKDIERLLSRGLRKFTPYSIASPQRLLDELTMVRATGLAHDREERVLGLACIAAPVRDHRGEVVAAISVSGSTAVLNEQRMAALSMKVKRVGAGLSRRLGWEPVGSAG